MSRNIDVNTICSAMKLDGYFARIDDDGDICFKFEGRSYFIQAQQEDAFYVRVVYPAFWSIADQSERRRALFAANQANAQIKIAKIFIMKDDVWADAEHLLSDIVGFEDRLKRSLSAIQAGAHVFREAMAA